jgi:hypothetical protein
LGCCWGKLSLAWYGGNYDAARANKLMIGPLRLLALRAVCSCSTAEFLMSIEGPYQKYFSEKFFCYSIGGNK